MTEAVYTILSGLNRAGYEAYIVGGAVRDKLMHKEPHDYDITTSARPEEIVAAARKEGWQCIGRPVFRDKPYSYRRADI